MNKNIVIGSDHAGFELKKYLCDLLEKNGYKIEDVGCYSLESCDYPIFAKKLCNKILKENSLGILICGSGIGMSITANRIKGIRAALCTNEYMARMSRRHNNANVLCLGARIIGQDLAESITLCFLKEEFEGGRHQKRIDLIDKQDL